ncbi:ParB N-terminal domain-containing protein [Methylobacterium sp. E-005]|uniref:ParB/RepB/Spo0J family partition protein n=1 Tax=Methylobacterium sp. E-005 TaxID=2836549 RepID=UPI001FBB664B|nr:ParB N-terminal domain-containing protein [Methylobacterium sp. E-005]MCJ2085531.1 ParB N-terminal domain-containing protein [Methylobacterium sp. E-005]
MARAQKIREVEPIGVDVIHVGDRLRAVSEPSIAMMAESLAAAGLLTPISVRVVEEMVIDGREIAGVPVLVAGATRLAAAKRLGWETIDTLVAEIDEVEARKQEIAENLHRTELTVQERAEHVAEWVRLREITVSDKLSETRREGRPGEASAVARDLGLGQREVRRAVQVASITPEAKEAAREAGLADNQSALLQVAKAEPARQVAVVAEIAEAKATKLDTDIKNRAAEEMAEAIVEHMPHALHGMMKENAWVCAKPLAIALTNLLGGAIIDKGAA